MRLIFVLHRLYITVIAMARTIVNPKKKLTVFIDDISYIKLISYIKIPKVLETNGRDYTY